MIYEHKTEMSKLKWKERESDSKESLKPIQQMHIVGVGGEQNWRKRKEKGKKGKGREELMCLNLYDPTC